MSIYKENLKSFNIKHIARIVSNAYYMHKAGEKAGKPFGIKFEVSSLCNLKCIMCPLSKGLKRKQGLLSFENFKKVFDETNPSYLNLTGIGEPLLNKDLFRIISYAKKHNSIIKLDTNATLLNEENAKKLLETQINIISVSIDSINKKIYEKIRKNAKFETTISNLRFLVELRNKEKCKTKIHINFVLQKENISELTEMIKFFDSIGIDSINGDIALPLGENKNEEKREISIIERKRIKKALENLKTKASLNIEHVQEFLERGYSSHKKNCFYPWYYPSITWDGCLVPCCYICDNEIVFGNVLNNGFMNVWNNEKIKAFRKMLANKKQGICKNCFIDESYIADKFRKISKIPIMRRLSGRKTL